MTNRRCRSEQEGARGSHQEPRKAPSSPPVLRHVILAERKCNMTPESFKHGPDQGADEREPVLPVSEPSSRPLREPGNRRSSPEGERSNWGPAGVVSDPDSRWPAEPIQGANPGAPGPEQRSVQVHEVMTRNVEVLR